MNKERETFKLNGFLAIGLIVLSGVLVFLGLSEQNVVLVGGGAVVALLLLSGITVVQPNESQVVTFFGDYKGTLRESGLWFTIPFSVRKKVSLRVRNFNSVKLKVNDIDGNPIEIAAVIVFKVVDTAKALFDVDKYEKFVEIQSETALRHVASKYPYDASQGISLRGNPEEVAEELVRELQDRLALAGVEVLEARLTHLAYSMEIAGAMLQRQQAAAILAARQTIVEGAVSIVSGAIEQIEATSNLSLSPEQKATMVNNLLVTIVSERGVSPVVNVE